jgi:arylformamidase
MKIHDISLPISPSMTIWPDTPAVSLARISDQANGDLATVSHLSMLVHTGTHIDAPLHFLQGGATIDSLLLETLCGSAFVCHALDADTISAEVLDGLGIPRGTERLLIRTRNSELWKLPPPRFTPLYVGVAADGAQWLVDHHVKLIGVDFLSVAPFADLTTTHQIMLRAGVIPLEGLDLSKIEPGRYMLYCLPLNLIGADGSPARVILIEGD